MYKREKSITLKSSASMVSNNLSIYVSPDHAYINYAVVHKSSVNIVTASTDGSNITHRQTACKDPSANSCSGLNGNRNIIMQACWVPLPARLVFVLASQIGIQMYEGESCSLLYWQSLSNPEKTNHEAGEGSVMTFARGVCGMSKNIICVGTSMGQILVYVVPQKGTKVQHKTSLTGHEAPIWDLSSDDARMVSSDDTGNIVVWQMDETSGKLFQHSAISGSGSPCTSVRLWGSVVAGGFGNGYIRVFDAKTGAMGAEVTAHARWIHSLHIAKHNGKLLSVSEDSMVHIWQLIQASPPHIEHVHSECISDTQLVGGAFIHDEGRAFCVVGYDSTELVFYVHK